MRPVNRSFQSHARILLALTAITVVACQSKPDPDAEPPAPKIGELAPRHTRPTSRPVDAAAIEVLVQKLEFSGRSSLEDATQLLDTEYINVDTQTRWRANGLRIASMPASRAADFAKALPPVASQGIRQLRPGAQADVFRAAPPVTETTTIQASARGDALEATRLPKGIPQWKVESPAEKSDGLAFKITPLHHYIKPSAIPRPPDEVAFDGTLFTQLAASIRLPKNHVLVIWWDRPAVLPFLKEPVYTTQPVEEVFKSEPAKDGESPTPVELPLPPGTVVQVVPSRAALATTTQPGEPDGPRRPTLIGDLLLVSTRFGKPMQTMLIFSKPESN